jgi:hypothetical protein
VLVVSTYAFIIFSLVEYTQVALRYHKLIFGYFRYCLFKESRYSRGEVKSHLGYVSAVRMFAKLFILF